MSDKDLSPVGERYNRVAPLKLSSAEASTNRPTARSEKLNKAAGSGNTEASVRPHAFTPTVVDNSKRKMPSAAGELEEAVRNSKAKAKKQDVALSRSGEPQKDFLLSIPRDNVNSWARDVVRSKELEKELETLGGIHFSET